MSSNGRQPESSTVLRLTEASLRSNQLAEMLESSSQAFALHYTDTRLSIFNAAFAALLGYPWDELKHLDWDLITPLKWVESEKAKLGELHRTGVSVRYEKEYTRKNGEVVPVELYVNLHHTPHGKPDYYYAFITDITIRKRAEELRDHIERVIQHDLRGPVSSALLLAGLLRDGTALDEEQRAHLLDLFEQLGQDMLDTLDCSLTLYKMEIKEYQPSTERFDCLAMVHEVTETLMKKGEFINVNSNIVYEGLPPTMKATCFCFCESKLLRTALRNLLRNALEAAAPDGHVVIEVSLGQDCRIEIRNKGVVPTEIRDRFFEKYVTQGKSKGTGIGTYSARMMVTAMGGDVAMRTSDLDNETVLTVHLPC